MGVEMFGNNNNNQPQDSSGFVPASPAEPGTSTGALNLPAPPSAPGVSPALPSSNDTQSTSDDTPSASTASPSPGEDSKPVSSRDDLLDNKDSDLLDIKQKALQHLSPLVGHLDQSPEEKFRTLMMMIQASDDQSLLSEAYEAAEKISDEKDRAQALLDVVNEINYFTQQKED
jgi:hypothetical protein